MFKTIVLIGVGGFLGSIFRYLISIFITQKIDLNFPLGTLMVNIIGCLLIGLFSGFFFKNEAYENLPFLVITGFLGGFTTFSSFSLETVNLLRNADFFKAGIYVFGSLVLGLIATSLGFWLTYGGSEKI